MIVHDLHAQEQAVQGQEVPIAEDLVRNQHVALFRKRGQRLTRCTLRDPSAWCCRVQELRNGGHLLQMRRRASHNYMINLIADLLACQQRNHEGLRGCNVGFGDQHRSISQRKELARRRLKHAALGLPERFKLVRSRARFVGRWRSLRCVGCKVSTNKCGRPHIRHLVNLSVAAARPGPQELGLMVIVRTD